MTKTTTKTDWSVLKSSKENRLVITFMIDIEAALATGSSPKAQILRVGLEGEWD